MSNGTADSPDTTTNDPSGPSVAERIRQSLHGATPWEEAGAFCLPSRLPIFTMPACYRHFRRYRPRCKKCSAVVAKQFEDVCRDLWAIQRGILPDAADEIDRLAALNAERQQIIGTLMEQRDAAEAKVREFERANYGWHR